MDSPEQVSIVSPSPLERAITVCDSQSELARRAGVSQAHVWNWLNKQGRVVPADKAIAVSQATGFLITPHELRPDIYPNARDGLPPDVCAALSDGAIVNREAA